MIGVFGDDIFAPESLRRIKRLSNRLAAIDGVREVLSLATAKGGRVERRGVSVGPLPRRLPRTAEEAAALRKKMLASALYVGNLVSADATATGVLVQFDDSSEVKFVSRGVERHVREQVESLFERGSVAITGMQTLKVNGARQMETDLFRFVPVSVALVVIILLWEFRTLRGALLPLATVLIGLVWTLGCMGLAGANINMGTLCCRRS